MESASHDVLDDEELKKFPAIEETIRSINDRIRPVYNDTTARAKENKKHHRLTVYCFGLFSSLASVTLAISESGLYTGQWLTWFPFLCLGVAVMIVISGLVAGFHRKWLIERHKSERLRQLKFRQMIDPIPPDRLEQEIRTIAEINSIRIIEEWIFRNAIEPDDRSWTIPYPSAAFSSFLEYYLRIRLSVQMNHCRRRSSQNLLTNNLTRFIPPAFFFASIFIGMAYFLSSLFRGGFDLKAEVYPGIQAGALLLFLFVLLPVIGAAIRTIRGANEYARNYLRYRTIYEHLETIRTRLEKNKEAFTAHLTGNDGVPEKLHYEILQQLYDAERTMAYEHQAWFTLMRDAEWFG